MTTLDRRGNVVSATDPGTTSDPNPGLAYKTAVQVATTANITLSGLQTIDGYAVKDTDRVLVKDQIDKTTNGIYAASSTGAWTRAKDADTASDFATGMQVYVVNGGTNGNFSFFLSTADNPVILGTSLITFSQVVEPPSGLEMVFDGGGTIMLPGDRVFLEVPFDCTVLRWTMVSNASNSITIDLYRTTYANFPSPTSICGTELPNLTVQQKNQSATLAGWTKTLSKGDILTGHIVSNSQTSLCTLSLITSLTA